MWQNGLCSMEVIDQRCLDPRRPRCRARDASRSRSKGRAPSICRTLELVRRRSRRRTSACGGDGRSAIPKLSERYCAYIASMSAAYF
jgi:hypothetical protein